MGARLSAPVQTGPGAHPASCTMGTGSFPGVKSGRGVTFTPHPLLMPISRRSRAIPLLPYEPYDLYSLSSCKREHFTFTLPRSQRPLGSCCSWCFGIFHNPELHARFQLPRMSVISRTPSIRESEIKLQEYFLRFISLHSTTENTSSERMTALTILYRIFRKPYVTELRQ